MEEWKKGRKEDEGKEVDEEREGGKGGRNVTVWVEMLASSLSQCNYHP